METTTGIALGVATFLAGLFLGLNGRTRRNSNSGKIDFLIDNALLVNKKLKKIMAADQEILAALEEANAATNEIADDITKLLAREPSLSPATKEALAAHVARLKGVAAQYTPEDAEGEEPTDPTV